MDVNVCFLFGECHGLVLSFLTGNRLFIIVAIVSTLLWPCCPNTTLFHLQFQLLFPLRYSMLRPTQPVFTCNFSYYFHFAMSMLPQTQPVLMYNQSRLQAIVKPWLFTFFLNYWDSTLHYRVWLFVHLLFYHEEFPDQFNQWIEALMITTLQSDIVFSW